MSVAVQERSKVRVTEETNSRIWFLLPGDLLSDDCNRPLMIFRTDDLQTVLPEDRHHVLHKLCAELMPNEQWCQVDHVIFSREKKQTRVQVQLNTGIPGRCLGRIDHALRVCDFDPTT